jgi:hypothetical protein
MSSAALQFLISLVSPVISLKQTIQEYQKKSKEKQRIKEDLANSLQAEIKEFEAVNGDFANLSEKILLILKRIDGQPTPAQVFQLIDRGSQIPRILAKLVILFIHLARACKDICKEKGFMTSLLTNNRFMYDLIERMGETYIGENTVKIDSSFFRFLLMYKREILKGSKIDKISKKEIEFLKKQAEIMLRNLNQAFLKRHMRRKPIKKWKASLTQFNKAFKYMKIDTRGMDISGLNVFMPSGLREIAPFLDKSPP